MAVDMKDGAVLGNGVRLAWLCIASLGWAQASSGISVHYSFTHI
jgi:hypothetical protein